ncbi:hypothetical protein D3C73_821070 [compost metagenome]
MQYCLGRQNVNQRSSHRAVQRYGVYVLQFRGVGANDNRLVGKDAWRERSRYQVGGRKSRYGRRVYRIIYEVGTGCILYLCQDGRHGLRKAAVQLVGHFKRLYQPTFGELDVSESKPSIRGKRGNWPCNASGRSRNSAFVLFEDG